MKKTRHISIRFCSSIKSIDSNVNFLFLGLSGPPGRPGIDGVRGQPGLKGKKLLFEMKVCGDICLF